MGYTANTAAQAQVLLLTNEHVFLPLLEKVDVIGTKILFGQEESLKSQQDWYYIKQNYSEPFFWFTENLNRSVLDENLKNNAEGPKDQNSTITTHIGPTGVDSSVDIHYTEGGVARDVGKVGFTGGSTKFVSDEPKAKEVEGISEKQWKQQMENPLSAIAKSMTTEGMPKQQLTPETIQRRLGLGTSSK